MPGLICDDRFLVSFLVDARGGSMRGSRHVGLRILVPPSAASAPTRVTCRMLRNTDRLIHKPDLNDGEGLACRILEMGPHPCKFNSPVLIEVPHFASLRDREREIVILRSDNGQVWKEHSIEATDQNVQETLGSYFDSLESRDALREKRIVRILVKEFPQYLAIISRFRQETAMIGKDGGVISSTAVPQVQAVFPEEALQKRIRVGLQAHAVNPELVAKLFGEKISVSPIVSVEPRRRKFHKPITLTIPLPKSCQKATISQSDINNLRLLCSIRGGSDPAQWEDITGSTHLSRVKQCVSFTTTVSARFWLVDCLNATESSDMGGKIYKDATVVPYMGKIVVFSKRVDAEEALLRCFCITDDKVDKTLECQEGFELKAASPEIEVFDKRDHWLEMAGNLVPVTKAGEQLRLHFCAFKENRLPFPVRLKDTTSPSVSGKIAFMRDQRTMSQSAAESTPVPQRPICTLEISLGPAATVDEVRQRRMLNLENQCSPTTEANYFPGYRAERDSRGRPLSQEAQAEWTKIMITSETIAKSELDLKDVAERVGADWPSLAEELGLTSLTIRHIRDEPTLHTDGERAFAVLITWRQENRNKVTGNELERCLRKIGREDVVKTCMKNISQVSEAKEKAVAKKQISAFSSTLTDENVVEENEKISVHEEACEDRYEEEKETGQEVGECADVDTVQRVEQPVFESLRQEQGEAECMAEGAGQIAAEGAAQEEIVKHASGDVLHEEPVDSTAGDVLQGGPVDSTAGDVLQGESVESAARDDTQKEIVQDVAQEEIAENAAEDVSSYNNNSENVTSDVDVTESSASVAVDLSSAPTTQQDSAVETAATDDISASQATECLSGDERTEEEDHSDPADEDLTADQSADVGGQANEQSRVEE